MKGWRFLYPLICLFILSSVAMSFDGQRKGFVMGGGAGLGVISTWKQEYQSIDESGMGIGWNITLGYAWDEQNITNWQWNGNSHNINHFAKQGIQFYTGPIWYHYFADKTKSLFSAVGVWQYAVSEIGEGHYATGWAGIFGAGYEFARHLQIGMYYSYAWIEYTDGSNEKGHSSHLNILLTVLAY